MCRDCCCECFHRLGFKPEGDNAADVVLRPALKKWMVACMICRIRLSQSALGKRSCDEADIDNSPPPKLRPCVALPPFPQNTPWSAVLSVIARTDDASFFRWLCADVREMIGRLVGATRKPSFYKIPLKDFRSSLTGTYPIRTESAERAVALGEVERLCALLDSRSAWDLDTCWWFAQLLEGAPHAQLQIDALARQRLIGVAIALTVENWRVGCFAPWALLAGLWTVDVADAKTKAKLLFPAISADLARVVHQRDPCNHVFLFLAALSATPGAVCDLVQKTFGALLENAFSVQHVAFHPIALLVRTYLTLHCPIPISPVWAHYVFLALDEPSHAEPRVLHAMFGAVETRHRIAEYFTAHDSFWPSVARSCQLQIQPDVQMHALRTITAGVRKNPDVAQRVGQFDIPDLVGGPMLSDRPEVHAHLVCLLGAFASVSATCGLAGPTLGTLFFHTVRWLAADPKHASMWPIDKATLLVVLQAISARESLYVSELALIRRAVANILQTTGAVHPSDFPAASLLS